jgi:hypothetical protein
MQGKYTAPIFIHLKCSFCGKDFDRILSEYKRGSGLRFCSIVCRNRSLALAQLGNRISCPICGTLLNPGSRNQNKTCSIECKLEKGRRAKCRVCDYCNKEFMTIMPGSNVRFCSRECVARSNISIKPQQCEQCYALFSPPTTTRKHRFCSRKCQMINMRGNRHPLWRGNRRHERGVTWKNNAQAARERDQICMSCGIDAVGIGQKLSVDHIVPFRLTFIYGNNDGKDPNDLCNLLCLCRSCHARKTRAESILLRGDISKFKDELNKFLPMDRVEYAFSFWGLETGMQNRLVFEGMPKFIVA